MSHLHPSPGPFPLSLLLLGVTACSSQTPYVYTPERASVSVDGMPGADHAIPPEQPQGDVRVASFGVTELTPAPGADKIPVLQVRMIVSNNGDPTPWRIDTRAQEIEIQGEGRSAPLYVNGNAPAPQAGNQQASASPEITVAQREQKTLDFYFPLPANVQSTDQLPHFDFLWQVETGARMVADRTRFDRQEREDDRAYDNVTVVAGWGPWWWYNPWYSGLVFIHPRPIVIREHVHSPVIAVPRPHRAYVGHPAHARMR